MTKIDGKSSFSIKFFFSISERHSEHPFAGQNTQHKGMDRDPFIYVKSSIKFPNLMWFI